MYPRDIYVYPRAIYVYPRAIYVYPKAIYVCLKDIYVCLKDIYVCLKDIYVCLKDVYVCLKDVYVCLKDVYVCLKAYIPLLCFIYLNILNKIIDLFLPPSLYFLQTLVNHFHGYFNVKPGQRHAFLLAHHRLHLKESLLRFVQPVQIQQSISP